MLDHSPADASGGLASTEEIAGRRTDLEGSEATHQMHRGSGPAQVWPENRPVIHQFNRLLLMQLLQQRLLADALPMPRGEPDPIRGKLLAASAGHIPLIGTPACSLHLAVFMKLEFAASLGLPEFCRSLRRDRTAVPCLQNEAAAAVHAGFCMKALEVFGAQPARIGIERLLSQGAAAQQLHPGAAPQRPEAEMGTGEPAADDQDPFTRAYPQSRQINRIAVLQRVCRGLASDAVDPGRPPRAPAARRDHHPPGLH